MVTTSELKKTKQFTGSVAQRHFAGLGVLDCARLVSIKVLEEETIVGTNFCEQVFECQNIPVYGMYKIIATCIERATTLPAQNNRV